MPAPFRIAVPDSELARLAQKLQEARYPDELQGCAPWEDGCDLAYLQQLMDYWRSGYDWSRWQAKLNEFAQYTAPINGIELHFIHEPAASRDAIPLLLLHGWPGSFFEFYKLIPLLKATGRYHLVVPSLPGYGFSSAPRQRGFGVTAIARTVDALMACLGYDKYIAQGGDWGAIICRALGLYHTASCKAIHLNMCVALPRWSHPLHLAQLANVSLLPSVPLALSAKEIGWVKELQAFGAGETGYQKIQGTKPQTLAYALHDSPVGLAAWITEKFHTWTDKGSSGRLEDAVTRDELLTNISIYLFGGRIASSMRLYKETIANKAEMGALFRGTCSTPTGVAILPREICKPPRAWAAAAYNLVQWSELDQGGHFAALEQPALLFGEVQTFGDLVDSKGWLR